MSERPIIMRAESVRAILAGTKRMTRRIAKPQPRELVEFMPGSWAIPTDDPSSFEAIRHPYTHGNRLWIRETWADGAPTSSGFVYRATAVEDDSGERDGWWSDDEFIAGKIRWRSPIFMPRDASRITLEIADVRVERLQEISVQDARAEGLTTITKDGLSWKYGIPDRDGLPGTDDTGWPWQAWELDPRRAYRTLWEKLHGAGSWAANPWVWVIEFRRVGAEVKAASVPLHEDPRGVRA